MYSVFVLNVFSIFGTLFFKLISFKKGTTSTKVVRWAWALWVWLLKASILAWAMFRTRTHCGDNCWRWGCRTACRDRSPRWERSPSRWQTESWERRSDREECPAWPPASDTPAPWTWRHTAGERKRPETDWLILFVFDYDLKYEQHSVSTFKYINSQGWHNRAWRFTSLW